MTIEAELQERLQDAMRARDRATLDAIRNVRTEIQRARTAPGFSGEADDAFVQGVVATYCKKLAKAIETYEQAGARGAQATAKLRAEIDYLSQWMPETLDAAATRALVNATIAELEVTDPKQAGKVMGAIMKGHKDEVDPKLVRDLVDEALRAG